MPCRINICVVDKGNLLSHEITINKDEEKTKQEENIRKTSLMAPKYLYLLLTKLSKEKGEV